MTIDITEALRLRAPGGVDALYPDRAVPVAQPGPGEIQVALRASSLNYHDYAVVTGIKPVADGRIPLSDGAGEVVAVGSGVTQMAVGDRVVSLFFPSWPDGRLTAAAAAAVPGDGIDGYACARVTAPAEAFTRAPRGWSHDEAATLTCAGLTAWRGLTESGLKSGDVVLVQGTGGVSIFALQFAKAAGAIVVATSSSAEKLERLRAMGAHYVINYREDEAWGATAHRLTGGIDHVIEVGGPGTLDQSVMACRNGGSITLVGVLTGRKGMVNTMALMSRQIRLTGATVGSRSQQLDMIRAVEACDIRPVIARGFALDDLADAFKYQESGLHFGKICIRIAE